VSRRAVFARWSAITFHGFAGIAGVCPHPGAEDTLARVRFNFARDVVEAADPAALALRFVDAGGNVCDLTFGDVATSAARWATLLRSRGVAPSDRVLVLVGKTPDWFAVMLAALKRFGRLDVALANAGFGAKRGFLEESPELWKSVVLTNVYGAALTIRACFDALVESKGHLLLTGSFAGRRALPGSLYSCTKFAISAMGEAARLELNGTGVRVTLIEPGMTDTPFFDERPLGVLEADDIARAVMYAVSQPAHVDVNELLIRPPAQEG
jgi:NAD(P)-dependent dehydrogenase (short-subunit alcohol dehydrogenase family)